MKKTKLVTILLLVAMIVVSFASIVNAAETPTTTMSVTANGKDKLEVKTGDEIEFVISITEPVAGANFLVEWDHNFLEYKSAVGALAKNPDEGRFEWVDTDGLTEFTIKFTVKATEGSDTIKVTPVKLTDGDTYEVVQKSNSVTLEIKKEETNTTPENTTEEPTNTTPENTTEEPTNTTPTNTTKEPDKMPQTGFNVAPVIGVAALVIVATVAIRRRK